MSKKKYSKEYVQKKISWKSKDLNHLNDIKINSQIKELLLMEVKQKKTNFKQTTKQKSEV